MDLTNLPDGIVSDVASYLAAPSRALLAVALTAPSASWWARNWTRGPLSMASAELLASPLNAWKELDFGDVEKALASRLTDDDLGAVFACIGAVERLKMLRLAGCVNVTGAGLEPLRNSTMLEDVDISLVGIHESTRIDPKPMLSEDEVLPILESLVASRSLKFVMLPKVWRERRSPELPRFLESFRDLLDRDEFAKCSVCNERCATAGDGRTIILQAKRFYGLQNFSCHLCRKYFCEHCSLHGGEDVDEDEEGCLNYCETCERDYCETCMEMKDCGNNCGSSFCNPCGVSLTACQGQDCQRQLCAECICEQCPCWSEILCDNCAPEHIKCEREGCSKSNCTECFDSESKGVKECDECERVFCTDCRISECDTDNREEICHGCLALIGDESAEGKRKRLRTL